MGSYLLIMIVVLVVILLIVIGFFVDKKVKKIKEQIDEINQTPTTTENQEENQDDSSLAGVVLPMENTSQIEELQPLSNEEIPPLVNDEVSPNQSVELENIPVNENINTSVEPQGDFSSFQANETEQNHLEINNNEVQENSLEVQNENANQTEGLGISTSFDLPNVTVAPTPPVMGGIVEGSSIPVPEMGDTEESIPSSELIEPEENIQSTTVSDVPILAVPVEEEKTSDDQTEEDLWKF